MNPRLFIPFLLLLFLACNSGSSKTKHHRIELLHNMGYMELDLPVEFDSMKVCNHISDHSAGNTRTIVFFNKQAYKLFPDTTEEYSSLDTTIHIPLISFSFSQRVEESANLSKHTPGKDYLDMIEGIMLQNNTRMKVLKKEMVNDFAVFAYDDCVPGHSIVNLDAFANLEGMSIVLNFTQYDFKDSKMLDKIIKTIESVSFSK